MLVLRARSGNWKTNEVEYLKLPAALRSRALRSKRRKASRRQWHITPSASHASLLRSNRQSIGSWRSGWLTSSSSSEKGNKGPWSQRIPPSVTYPQLSYVQGGGVSREVA